MPADDAEDMDTAPLVIDLTDAALARRRATTCSRCATPAELYRLIGTESAFCGDCFGEVHAPSA